MIEDLFNCCIIDEDERKDLLQLAEESTDPANPFQSQVCRSSGAGQAGGGWRAHTRWPGQ
jgi:hypothetical protein